MKIGVTGGIGSGKSLVVRELERLGCVIYKADEKAKNLTHNSEIKKAIIALFGQKAYHGDQYNSPYIASIVFRDKTKLEQLNDIIHPAVFKDFAEFCECHRDKTIVYESALIIETQHTHLFDKIILVTAPLELRIHRVMQRDQISQEEVMSRIGNQMPDDIKRKSADWVINNVDREETVRQIEELWIKELQ